MESKSGRQYQGVRQEGKGDRKAKVGRNRDSQKKARRTGNTDRSSEERQKREANEASNRQNQAFMCAGRQYHGSKSRQIGKQKPAGKII